MLMKEITFKDLDGVERTETHYFNMTKAEMLEYDAQFERWGGVLPYLTMVAKNKSPRKMIATFKDLILRSYGEKTASGRFVKSKELSDAFAASEAYSELFMEITMGDDAQTAAAAFINGIIPQAPDEQSKPGNVSKIPAPIG